MAVNQTAMLSAIRPSQSPCSRRAYSWSKGLPWCSRGTVKHHSFCVTCKETPNRVNLSLARCTKWRQRQTHGELQERWSFLVWAFPDTRWDVANVQCQLILIKGAQQSDAKYLLSAQRIKLHCFQHTVLYPKKWTDEFLILVCLSYLGERWERHVHQPWRFAPYAPHMISTLRTPVTAAAAMDAVFTLVYPNFACIILYNLIL